MGMQLLRKLSSEKWVKKALEGGESKKIASDKPSVRERERGEKLGAPSDQASSDDCSPSSPEVDSAAQARAGHHRVRARSEVFSYRLSCSSCNSPGVHYVNDTGEGQTVADALNAHYKEMWRALKGSRRGSVACPDMNGKGNCDFGQSALCRHLMSHCQSIETRAELMSWCQENVKVHVRKRYSNPSATDGTFRYEKKREDAMTRRVGRKCADVDRLPTTCAMTIVESPSEA